MTTELLDKIALSMDAGASALTKTASGLDEIIAKFRETPAPAVKPETEAKDEVAELEQGAIAGIMKTEVWGIPLGRAAAGGFVAILASEIVDGFFATQTKNVKGLVKLVAAGAIVNWGRNLPFIGKEGAIVVALLLTFDALRDITPLDEWANRLANGISGAIPRGGLGAQLGSPRLNVVAQAERVAGDYYSTAEGR